MLFSKEHYDLMTQFEKDCKDLGVRFQREDKEIWKNGHIYQNGDTNNLFIAYRRGHAFGKMA